MLKKEIRLLGIDDSPFKKGAKGPILVVGALTRGGTCLEAVLSTSAKIDGNDSTARLIAMVNKSRFKSQVRCIFLNGIAVGGFNVIDIHSLNRKTSIPVVVVIRKQPDVKNIRKALVQIGLGSRFRLIEKAGKVIKINGIFVQQAGISVEKAREFLSLACTRSKIPEPLRLAHIIASGIVRGESRGKA